MTSRQTLLDTWVELRSCGPDSAAELLWKVFAGAAAAGMTAGLQSRDNPAALADAALLLAGPRPT